jgi:hypothetical protein
LPVHTLQYLVEFSHQSIISASESILASNSTNNQAFKSLSNFVFGYSKVLSSLLKILDISRIELFRTYGSRCDIDPSDSLKQSGNIMALIRFLNIIYRKSDDFLGKYSQLMGIIQSNNLTTR